MKNNFKYYAIIWAILLAIYNIVVFAVRPLPGFTITYDARFFVSWGLTIAAFCGQLVCAYNAFKADSKEKLFLNIPLITQSYMSLILMTIAAGILMLIPNCPAWISVIVCVVILGFSVTAVLKAKAAANLVSEVEDKLKGKPLFIKSLTADAEALMARAKTDELKSILKNVYEAIRYSDPMSSEGISGIEAEITLKFNELIETVDNEDIETVKERAEELTILISDRNKKCKVLK